MAYILEQVEPMVCGDISTAAAEEEDSEENHVNREDVEEEEDEEEVAGAVYHGEAPYENIDNETWRAACRLQSGARGVFRSAHAQLDDASLTEGARGAWVDAAVADLFVGC